MSVGHSWFFAHVVPHSLVAVLQIGADARHRELSTHWTHLAVAGLQSGRSLGHSESNRQLALHVFVFGSHTGLSAAQSAPLVHPTHVSLEGSQTGVAPVHAPALPGRHATQKPSGSLHTGAPVEQFASEAHPSVHV